MTDEEIISYLKNINKAIKDNDFSNARKLLRKTYSKEFKKYKIIVKHLKAKISELEYDEDDIINIEYAKMKLRGKKYDEALSIFYDSLISSNKNIFNYYVGRSLYKMGYQLEALDYLKKYIDFGGIKLANALMLCTLILRNHKRRSESNYYIELCEKINDFNESEYELINFDLNKDNYKLCYKKQGN